LGKNKGFWLKQLAFQLKDKMEGIILKHLAPLPASILDAMILGERRGIPRFINNAMIKTGTVHILVVSGFNVGIVIFVFILLLKLLRLSRQLRFIIVIPAAVIYCFVTGVSNPVVRATIMAIIFMLGFLLAREADIYNSLSISALFILGFNPRQLFDIGFQLSFASVASIICLYPKIRDFLRLGRLKIRFIRFLIDGCLVSLSAWAGTSALVAYYFHLFSPVAVLANLFIVPLASLITLCGFSLIAAEIICPPLAPLFARSAELAVYLLIGINALLLKLPFAYLRLA
jgi:competence protein ComEC